MQPETRSTGGNWQVRVLRPGRSPLQSLATTLDETIDTGTIAADIVDRLHEGPGLYGELLRKAATRKKHKASLNDAVLMICSGALRRNFLKHGPLPRKSTT